MKFVRFLTVAAVLGIALAGCDSKSAQTNVNTQQAVQTQQSVSRSAASGSTVTTVTSEGNSTTYTTATPAQAGQTVSFDVPSYRANDVRKISVHIEKTTDENTASGTSGYPNQTYIAPTSYQSPAPAAYTTSSNAQPFHGLTDYQPNQRVYTTSAPLFHGLSDPCPNPRIYTPSSCPAPLPLFHGLQ